MDLEACAAAFVEPSPPGRGRAAAAPAEDLE